MIGIGDQIIAQQLLMKRKNLGMIGASKKVKMEKRVYMI